MTMLVLRLFSTVGLLTHLMTILWRQHHPVIVLNFREVGVRTLTHVAFHETPDGSHVRDQGVTAFDVRLAMRVEKLYEDYVARGYHFVPKSKPPS